jgi:hypothetical protein
MKRPNFCCNCGAKILRVHWHVWTSRKLCNRCSRELFWERVKAPLTVIAGLLLCGFLIGRLTRPAPAPLVVERAANSPLFNTNNDSTPNTVPTNSGIVPEQVYICGARTKKGTPCSRRVSGPVRCWQHKGMPAMKPQAELAIK